MGTEFPLKSLPKISYFKVLVAKSPEVEEKYLTCYVFIIKL